MFKKKFSGYLIFSFICFSIKAFADDNSQLKDFKLENLKEISKSKIDEEMSLESAVDLYLNPNQESSNKKLFKYNVNGSYQSYITSDCHYTSLSQILNQSSHYLSDKAKHIQAWIDKCQGELSRFTSGTVSSLVKFSTVNYPINNNSKLQYVQFQYDNTNTIVDGILGIKDNKKRPLVIVKNGLYGEANESSVSKNFFMHLFDESPFHVLLLGNVTGKDFLKNNGYVALGGYDEGRQVHEVIAQLLNSEEYKDLIEDIHMVGVSLGGNAALFSSLYSSYRGAFANKFKSVIAVCPVVNLQNSFTHMFSNSVVGIANAVYSYKFVLDIFDSVPILKRFLSKNRIWTKSEISKAIVNSATDFYKNRTMSSPWGYAPFEMDVINNTQEFWFKNNFVNYADEVQIPTLVLHSNDDPIVREKENASLLSKFLKNKNSQVAVVNFNHGAHCGYNMANGWPTMSTMLREFILTNSSYVLENPSNWGLLNYTSDVQAESEKIKDLKFVKYEWKAKKGSDVIDLNLTYFNPNNKFLWFKLCNDDYRKADPANCFYSRTYKVHLDSFRNLKISVPQNDYEVSSLSRWLNTNVTPTNSNGESPYGKSVFPTKYYSHFH